MPNSSQSSKDPASSPDAIREQNQKAFRQYLRQADKLIIERQFPQAKQQLAEAKKIDPTNPFIIAFEERIAVFENKPVQGKEKAAAKPEARPEAKPEAPPPEDRKAVKESPDREGVEQKLRQEVEEEFRERFTQELRSAEEKAAKTLEDERAKLESQRKALEAKHEAQLAAARKSLEAEFEKRLAEELEKADKELERKHREDLGAVERDLKAQLTEKYEGELKTLREQGKKEQDEVIEREHRSLQEHERAMSAEFNQKLLAALRKAESVYQDQSLQQQKMVRDELAQKLKEEHEAQLAREREELQRQQEVLKTGLEESFRNKETALREEMQKTLEAQLAEARTKYGKELEEARVAIRRDIEKELQSKHQAQLKEERDRLKAEADEAIDRERKRLDSKYTGQLKEQSEKFEQVRIKLKNEMEKAFLKRLERIAEEYDHKMDLLGARVPASPEERRTLYRERLRRYYANGQPSVEDAKTLMQLKELLQLSFDEHLAIEADVRMELYARIVEKKILSGDLTPNAPKGLEKLKQQFGISPEESSKLEPYILASFQRLARKGRILLVDDDILLLKTMQDMLTESGYQVATAPDIATGLEKLKSTAVDLILSDIKFAVGDLDGFKFFKTVQEQPEYRNIPFVFMSSLQDGVIIRSGVQLGVDDYLTKPIDPDLLIAVIEGKLKRFRNLSRN